MASIWGAEFDIPKTPEKTKKVIEKIASPKSPKVVSGAASMKKLSLNEKLAFIESNVNKVLGRYEGTTQVITDRAELSSYIDAAIANNIIAVDTETNNSLDPISCKIMGLCLYTPGQKNVYVPINHINSVTQERLPEQLTERDVQEALFRLSNTKILTHNGKFDYEVLKCTTGVEISIYWDTMIAAKILNENENSVGLKQQFIEKIDPSVEKYSIDHLFNEVEYAVVPYKLFSLYSATDAYMTYKLYEWQKKQFEKPENSNLLSLFHNVEMPVVLVTAEMELAGICLDTDYAGRLSRKYHKKVDLVDAAIESELAKYSDIIARWRLTPEANIHPPKKSGNGEAKSKSEQLCDPLSVTSPTQLAILLYDVLGQNSTNRKSPRGTGEEILTQMNLPLCKLILEKRGLEKLIGTYIDKLPSIIQPTTYYNDAIIDVSSKALRVDKNTKLETSFGFVKAENIRVEDSLIFSDENHIIVVVVTNITQENNIVTIEWGDIQSV